MIFIDSNVPMYLIGAAHPHKIDAQRLLERQVTDRQRLVTSVEVFQEILHRYVGIGRRDAIEPAFQALRGVVDEVYSVDYEQVERAKVLVLARPRLTARDALHLATMERHGIARIMSFDTDFDQMPGISRLH